jgi:uncharacterized SAM-binding protein YcdF (DUF218 family)
MMVVSLILFVAIGLSPAGDLLTYALESRFPPWDPVRGAPDGIVVLGGNISPKLSRDHGEPVVGSDAARIVAMAKLARSYPNARIVYSGGDASLLGNQPPEGDFVRPLLDIFGIARERVLLEARSRNTGENATFTKDLVKPKPGERWLLVTSALLPSGRISDRGLSGWLAHRAEIRPDDDQNIFERLGPVRFRRV